MDTSFRRSSPELVHELWNIALDVLHLVLCSPSAIHAAGVVDLTMLLHSQIYHTQQHATSTTSYMYLSAR